jgi:hypothetical protein
MALIKTFETEVIAHHAVQLKDKERQELQDLMAQFLKNGGEVVSIPAYVNCENIEAYRPMTQQEELAVKARCGLKASARMTLIYRPQERLWHATLGIWSLGLYPSQLSAEDAIRTRAKEVFAESKTKPRARYSDKEIGELLNRVERNGGV